MKSHPLKFVLRVFQQSHPVDLAPLERKRGGPEQCPAPCEACKDGRHHFGQRFGFQNDPTADAGDTSTGPSHPAARAGLDAWQNCLHCEAWREMLNTDVAPGDADFDGFNPRDWI
jgi:hypothetical protein